MAECGRRRVLLVLAANHRPLTLLEIGRLADCDEADALETLWALNKAGLALRLGRGRWIAAHWACRLAAQAAAGDGVAAEVLRLLG